MDRRLTNAQAHPLALRFSVGLRSAGFPKYRIFHSHPKTARERSKRSHFLSTSRLAAAEAQGIRSFVQFFTSAFTLPYCLLLTSVPDQFRAPYLHHESLFLLSGRLRSGLIKSRLHWFHTSLCPTLCLCTIVRYHVDHQQFERCIGQTPIQVQANHDCQTCSWQWIWSPVGQHQ